MGHNVTWRPTTSKIKEFIPPWTVSREFWIDSLKPEHSGIYTDIMLFGNVGLSLAHHYKILRNGLPHIAFRRDYMTRLRTVLEPWSVGALRDVPRPRGSVAHGAEPMHIRSGSVGDVPVLAWEHINDSQKVEEDTSRTSPFHRSQVIGTLCPTTTQPARGTPSVSVPLENEKHSQINMSTKLVVAPVGGGPLPPNTSKDIERHPPTPVNFMASDVDGLPVATESRIRPDGVDDLDLRMAPDDMMMCPETVLIERTVSPASIDSIWRLWMRGMRRMARYFRAICRRLRAIGTCRTLTGFQSRRSRRYKRLYRMWRK